MRKAKQILEEIVKHVGPKAGCEILVIEKASASPNWAAEPSSNSDAGQLIRMNEKVADLRETDALIDWSGVPMKIHDRRIVHWMHERK
jgi:hypothetical protein